MSKESKLFKTKAVSSLLWSIEHFNSVRQESRMDAVLIFMDHSFEMLLKGAILHNRGRIRERREKNTIGFDACVRRALSEMKFISQEQAFVLQTINGLRDAVQHYFLDLSEGQLYVHAQSGVTLFRDLLRDVFDEDLADYLPERVLPLSTTPPRDPIALFTDELEEVRALLAPGRRQRTEAEAKLRGLAIVDSALQGEKYQPGTSDLRKLGDAVAGGKKLEALFPGIAAINFTTDGEGSKLSLRISKKEGMPVVLVPEGTPGASVIGVKRVDDLGYYNLGLTQIAKSTGLTPPKATAAVRLLGLQNDAEYFKEIVIGKTRIGRYSQKSLEAVRRFVEEKGEAQIWKEYKELQAKIGAGVSS